MTRPSLVNIDSGLRALEKQEVTAEVIDTYVSMYSFGMLDEDKRVEHLLELVTNEKVFWEHLVKSADRRFWVNSGNFGIAIFEPNQDCGYTRAYRYNSSVKYSEVLELRSSYYWKQLKSEITFLEIIKSLEAKAIFDAWKTHKIEVNSLPTEFAEGRLENTDIDRVWIVTKGNGCAICGEKAFYQARTTLTEESSLLLTINLCKAHQLEAQKHPCVLVFFGTLFTLQLDVGDLVKLDHIPDQLIVPICELISSHLEAEYSEVEKRQKGWHIKFTLSDNWYWLLRLNTLSDYAYMLFDDKKTQKHRIDSANHHPDIPFGPAHQHFNSTNNKHKLAPSFTYGIPALDFPALINAKKHYS